MQEAPGTGTQPASWQGEACVKMPPPPPWEAKQTRGWSVNWLRGVTCCWTRPGCGRADYVPSVAFDQWEGWISSLGPLKSLKNKELTHLCVFNTLWGRKTPQDFPLWHLEKRGHLPVGNSEFLGIETAPHSWLCGTFTLNGSNVYKMFKCHLSQEAIFQVNSWGKVGYSAVPASEICFPLTPERFILPALPRFLLLLLNNDFWIINFYSAPI